MLESTEALFLPRGLGRGSSEHLPTASRRHIAGRATPECVATDARVKDLAERNLPPAQNGRKRQRASEGAQMHSRERDSPNSRWTYALHAHCDRMPSMFGVCDRPKPPLLSPRLLSRGQATTPENLNQTSNEDLFSRVEAVLSTVNATDAARRAVLAPFVTNALALRIYNHLQERVNDGTCELPAQVALALVILDLTNVLPPDDRGEQELIGHRFYKSLFDKCGHLDRKRAITKRGNSAETKARQRKSEDEALMRWPWGEWPAPGTKALVPQVKPRVERGGAGPSGNAALRLVQLENAELRLLPADVKRAESKRDQARAMSAVHAAIAREAKRAAKEERSRAETAATMAARA